MAKNKVITDESLIDEFLARGVENVFPNKEFLKSRLIKGEKLTVYLGVDPTSPRLHLGHTITLRKLGQLQKLGHQVILLIGDFTAMIGDPTDKSAVRKQLTRKDVMDNCKEYKTQVEKFISFTGSNKAILKYNSEWLAKMNFEDVLKLSSLVTVEQMLKRDMFQKRMEEKKPIFIHEFMYPLMQGQDSVAMDVDGEIGGNDQTFNMLVGRDLVKAINKKEKFVLATKLLVDASGKKMSKTEGNLINLDDSPEDIYGKVMSFADSLIIPAFELLTDTPMSEIEKIKSSLSLGDNPRDAKMKLAKEIVIVICGSDEAIKSEQNFINTFKKGEMPDNATEIEVENGKLLKDVLVKELIVASNAEWQRLVSGKAVSIVGTEEVINDPYIKAEKDISIRIGKKRFVKVKVI